MLSTSRSPCLPAILLVAGLSSLTSSSALATSVFLNGVNIDGVTGQRFENCTVTIDDKGNILITAKGYEVQGAPAKNAAAEASVSAEPVTKRYFLVSETSAVGLAQYDIDVYVNSQWVKRVAANESQVVLEITKQMRKGRNVVHFTSTKAMKDGRKSTSPAHFVKVHIGEGSIGGNNVMIDNNIVEYTRTAAETQLFDDDVIVVGR
jgi:hypothetical protein